MILFSSFIPKKGPDNTLARIMELGDGMLW